MRERCARAALAGAMLLVWAGVAGAQAAGAAAQTAAGAPTAGVAAQTTAGGSGLTGLGSPATPEEIDAWGAIVGPAGEGLPAGGGTAAEGRSLYDRRCAACHGATGREGPDDALAGGQGSLAGGQARKTVGSFWPAATTLWDYVNRAMPFNQPGSLAPDEVYAVVAYVLYLNDIVGEDDRIDAGTLPQVEMPNRGGFVADPRPDLAEPPGRADSRSDVAVAPVVADPPDLAVAPSAAEPPATAAVPPAAAAVPSAAVDGAPARGASAARPSVAPGGPAAGRQAALAQSTSAARPSAASALDGVFTAAQAARGERTFREACAVCHDTAEFSGGRFRIGWVGRPVGELFETISTLMPEADPGSLSRAQYAAIVAYLLQLNGYPAGDDDLPSNGRALGQLEIAAPPAP